MLPLALDQYHFKFDQHPHNLSNFVKLKVVSQFRLSKSTLSKCLNFWFDQFASENCQRLCQEEEQEEWPHACPSGYWSCPLEAEPAGAPHPPPTTPPSARQPPLLAWSAEGCTPALCNAMALYTGKECRAKTTLSHANC